MGKQIQFTKKDAYHTPGKAKRERISSILRDIELSEYIEEDESVSLKTIRRLLNYCQYPEEEELMVGIQAIKHIGKALYGDEDAFLEVIDEESLCCMAEQYLAM